ncbi:MAG: efflux RND transporter periplasmic adaptor subunit [Akkermansiaceae bacterium]
MTLFLKIIAPFAIIAIAIMGFVFLGKLAPKPKSKEPPPVIPLVELFAVSADSHKPPVTSFGTVTSFFETDLTPQVNGRIMFVSSEFRVGEKVKSGHVLVRIDSRDFEAALATQAANLTVAERSLAEEEIRAEQAAGDWKASGRKLSTATEFVLRKPQLAAAKANIESAKAAIKKAEADLERTEVRAPFDAVITARQASPGNQASPQQSLGTLVATEKVEIRLPLTAEQSNRVEIPCGAVLTSPLKPGVEWAATLVRMEPTVDQRNQVMYAVAEVENPYEKGKEPLPVGMFANATIEAKAIEESYRVPEAAFVNDEYIWAVNEKTKLERLEAEMVFGFGGNSFLKLVDGTKGELRVVTRPLSNFRTGMEVKHGEAQTKK